MLNWLLAAPVGPPQRSTNVVLAVSGLVTIVPDAGRLSRNPGMAHRFTLADCQLKVTVWPDPILDLLTENAVIAGSAVAKLVLVGRACSLSQGNWANAEETPSPAYGSAIERDVWATGLYPLILTVEAVFQTTNP